MNTIHEYIKKSIDTLINLFPNTTAGYTYKQTSQSFFIKVESAQDLSNANEAWVDFAYDILEGFSTFEEEGYFLSFLIGDSLVQVSIDECLYVQSSKEQSYFDQIFETPAYYLDKLSDLLFANQKTANGIEIALLASEKVTETTFFGEITQEVSFEDEEAVQVETTQNYQGDTYAMAA